MVVEPKEADIVKTIFRMKDGEGATYKRVVDHLNSRGLLTEAGQSFPSARFRRFMKTGKYIRDITVTANRRSGLRVRTKR